MTDEKQPIIVWFRRDLRIEDNPALAEAGSCRRPVIPVYIVDHSDDQHGQASTVAQAWRLQNAQALDASLRNRYGSRLTVRAGDPCNELQKLAAETGAAAIFLNAVPEPDALAWDKRFIRSATEHGIAVRVFQSNLLMEPGTVLNQDNRPYKVFTPFYRRFLQSYRHTPPLPAPRLIPAPAAWPRSTTLEHALGRLPEDICAPAQRWTAGENAAAGALDSFIDGPLHRYSSERDLLAGTTTSRLSPYLQCGAISARRVWDAVQRSCCVPGQDAVPSSGDYLRQIVWREFSYHTLAAFPELPVRAYRKEFDAFPWEGNAERLSAWQRGLTGYPVVDASMRQLRREGWLPGRARMVAASFLIKHLMLNWTAGEQWFRKRLIDADPACNAFNWQWVAGSGTDAAPYFRIFNPIVQGRKFDPGGEYARGWLPELAQLPVRYIHSPWTAPISILNDCGIELGTHYPRPLVDHRTARDIALAAWRSLRSG